ncbi:kinase-like protein [Fomitiporia mediterranea MF3/22]|uniref:kinase-like protein n=1 Tax=Fomitiporia mediterranea (strain MF3/22) TaxID=694068 RepID=UPI000440855A|nr:kinase-like protein [Fomitiporia mediterranea MF3/22]EJD07978.1 kinase-like protein [Fomitiporia mediterranea MF3/22]
MSISTQIAEAAVISDLNVIKLREGSTAKFDNEWTKENLTLTVLPPPDKDTVQPLQTGAVGLVYRVVHEGIKGKIKEYDGQAEFAAKIIPKRQLCEGVAFLHREYVHLDIKPDNLFIINKKKPIYLSQTELLVIGDLQYLSRKDSTGKVSSVIGTENYVAPEILLESGTECTDKVDMWSIGVTTFGLLFNAMLYPTIGEKWGIPKEHRPGTILQKTLIIDYFIEREQNKRLAKGRPRVSFKAIDFVRQCLQRDPSRRISAKDALTQPISWLYKESIEEAIRHDFEVKGTWRKATGKVMARKAKRDIEKKHAHSWHSRMQSGSSSQDGSAGKKSNKNADGEHQDKHISPAQKQLEGILQGSLERHGSKKRSSTDTSGSCVSM